MSAAQSGRLKVTSLEEARAIVLFPEGEVDMDSYDTFRAALSHATSLGRPNVVVDLARVTYIDSLGLGALVSGLRDAKEAGCRMCLVSQNAHLSRVLDVTGLSRLFRVYQRREDALEESNSEE
jgi:anti-anti-sigma factor